MAKPNDISSTERLLNVIRNTTAVNETPVPPPPVSGNSRLLSLFRKLSVRSAPAVGIDISGEYLRLVKVGTRLDNKPAVLDFRSAPLTDKIAEDRERLIDLLRSELTRFCPSPRPVTIWTLLPLEETDIRRFLIPRVSKSKLENAVYWTHQKEAAFDKNQMLLDFRVLGDIVDNGVAKIEVVACTAPRAKVSELKAWFRAAGVELTGVLAPAFAFQNFYKAGWVDAGDALSCSLLIDFNWSRIDIFRPNGDLIVSRGIKAGISSMVESIKSEVTRPAGNLSMTGDMDEAASVLELSAFDVTEADQILKILSTDAPAPPLTTTGIIKSDDVFDMVEPALERLVRQVERTLEHVTLRFSDGPIEKMFISGPIAAYPRLVNHIGSQLGLTLEVVEPFSSVSGGIQAPEAVSDRAAYVSSVGLALSNIGNPPNFLCTHQDSVQKTREKQLHGAVLFFFLLGAVALWGVHQFQQHHIRNLEKELYQLNLAAAPGGHESAGESLLMLAAKVNKKNRIWKAYSRKYLPVAVIGEITTLAADHIRFIRIEGNGPGPPAAKPHEDENQENKPPAEKTTVAVDAVVRGPRNTVETRLARYLMALKNSPLFTRVVLKKKNFEHIGSQEVLRFTLDMEGALDR